MERYDEISDIVLNILKTNPDKISIIDLADRTNIHRNVLAKYLKVLEAQGKIRFVREGAKKFIELSKKIPSSFLSSLTSHPCLIFDRHLNILDASLEAKSQFYPDEIDDEAISRRMDFTDLFLTSEIRDILHSSIEGSEKTSFLDTVWDGENHSYQIRSIPVVLDNGRSGSALIIKDITERNEQRLLYEMTLSAYDALMEDQIQFVVRFSSDYKIIFANSVFLYHLGAVEENLINSPFISSYPSESFQTFQKGISEITHDQPLVEIDLRRVVSSGDVSWEHWRIRGIFDSKTGKKMGYHAVGIDITEYKRHEQELSLYKNNLEQMISERTNELRQVNSDLHQEIFHRETIERELVLTKFAIDHAHDLVFLLKPDGEIQYLNLKAQEMIGEINTKNNIRFWISPTTKFDPEPDLSLPLDDTIPTGSTVKGFLQSSRSPHIPIEITTSLIQYQDEEVLCCIARDITDRKKVERDLAVYRTHLEKIIEERTTRLHQEIEKRSKIESERRDLEERYNGMVSYSIEAVLILNINTKVIIDSNPQAQNLFGYSKGEICKNVEFLLLNDKVTDENMYAQYRLFIKNEIVLSELTFISIIRDHTEKEIKYLVRLVMLPSDTDVIIRAGFIEYLETE